MNRLITPNPSYFSSAHVTTNQSLRAKRSNLLPLPPGEGRGEGVFLAFVFLLALCAPFATAQDFQPVPVSEYAEKTGPNTMTFLSYPKYYKTAEGELTLAVTDLVESKSADWDFEVETGIWTLRVKTDGTFQAEHQGNVFTYRLSQMGVGRGDGFQAFEWGEPNWKNYQVIGDAIRWYDVFPNIDLKVRYIHDILKVDVIVKAELMSQMRTEVLDGKLNADDYLTARFDIPNVWVTGEARQGGEVCDLYADRLDVQQPVEFVKDGKVVQKLRPVETYVLDEKGEPIVSFEKDGFIRSAQTWQLKKNASGVAEMSANLGDLVKAQDGDVVIDPSAIFTGEGFYGAGDTYDTYISQQYPSTNYGTSQYLYLDGNTNAEKRILLGFSHATTKLAGRTILSATIGLYPNAISGSPSNATACAYKVTHNWYMSSVTWTNSGSGGNWSSSGGDYTTDYQSKYVKLPTSVDGKWVEFDVSQTFKSHYTTSTYDPGDKGFLIKTVNSPSAYWRFYASEFGTAEYRPVMVVQFSATNYGAEPGGGWWEKNLLTTSGVKSATQKIAWPVERRLDYMKVDNLNTLQYICHLSFGFTEVRNLLYNICYNAKLKGVKVIPQFTIGDIRSSTNAIDLSDTIRDTLQAAEDFDSYISDGVIVGVEIGGEEESKWKDNPPSVWFGDWSDGANFADYYLPIRHKIKKNWPNLKIISGGSIEKHDSLKWNPNNGAGSAGEFIRGFIARVIEAATSVDLGKYDYLPESISIHSYTGVYPPENLISAERGKPITEFQHRLKELYDLCNDYGYLPNFCITEYGYSPNERIPISIFPLSNQSLTNGYACGNATEETQAVYYLRSVLISSTNVPDATMSTPKKGIGWEWSSCFHHPQDFEIKYDGNGVAQSFFDFGFFEPGNYPNGNMGNERAVLHLAHIIHSTTQDLQIGNEGTKIWSPIQFQYDSVNYGLAWCGWETNSGQKWGAIWRYRHLDDYYSPTATDKNFIIDGDWEHLDNNSLYRFSLSYGSAVSNSVIGAPTGNESGGKTTFSIPSVTENPIFIKFNE